VLVVAVAAVLPATGPVADAAELVGSEPVWFSLIAYLAQAFLLQAIPEELLFRGWLLSSLRARPGVAIVASTLAFTAIHLVSSGGQQNLAERFVYLALPLGFSLLAVGLLLWSGSLWAAVGVHGGFHVGMAVVATSLPAVDPVLSWVAIGAAQGVAGLVLIVTGHRDRAPRPGEGAEK
jgi:membrane protease YdiL (CAAX protease family)